LVADRDHAAQPHPHRLAVEWRADDLARAAVVAKLERPALLAIAALVFAASAGLAASTLSLVVLGLGWSLSTAGASAALHAQGQPRWCLAAHDCTVLAAAVAGALASPFLW